MGMENGKFVCDENSIHLHVKRRVNSFYVGDYHRRWNERVADYAHHLKINESSLKQSMMPKVVPCQPILDDLDYFYEITVINCGECGNPKSNFVKYYRRLNHVPVFDWTESGV